MKKMVQASEFEEVVELYLNDEYVCDLEWDYDYYKIPIDVAKKLLLDDGDVLVVEKNVHEVD